ncbi:hypothetical protein EDB19DRAFT_1828150 [Suillus lakei]|nr:hypothetical protein EDB19DRAFT_1828150 [Suillus lakei]
MCRGHASRLCGPRHFAQGKRMSFNFKVLLPTQIDRAVELNHGTHQDGNGVAARCSELCLDHTCPIGAQKRGTGWGNNDPNFRNNAASGAFTSGQPHIPYSCSGQSFVIYLPGSRTGQATASKAGSPPGIPDEYNNGMMLSSGMR